MREERHIDDIEIPATDPGKCRLFTRRFSDGNSKVGATFSKDIFPVPGRGRLRFFTPTGTENAIWPETADEQSE